MKFQIVLPLILTATILFGQTSQPVTTTVTAVPRLVRINSTFRPVTGAAAAVESATLSIYAAETGGTSLWQEVQNVPVDSEGRYSVLLGSTRNEGLPVELFTAGEPRWLGVQFQRAGEVEQPRVLLASVPYALKAADAETLGGQPASAYMLAPAGSASSASAGGSSTNPAGSIAPAKLTPKVTSGTSNSIARFVNTTDLGDSSMHQSLNNGNIGIGTTAPAAALEISTVGGGAQFTNTAANNFTFNTFSSPGNASYIYNFGNLFATSGRYVQNSFLFDAGNILSLSAASNVRLYTNGNNERVRIDSNGKMGIGTAVPATTLDVAGDISFSGNIFISGSRLIQHFGNANLAVGINSLPAASTGIQNVALGQGALNANTSGGSNTALGDFALETNTSASNNTAVGEAALLSNSIGLDNTAVGFNAQAGNLGSNNTAVGSNALAFIGHQWTGNFNTALGQRALNNLSSGDNNIAIGQQAGSSLTTGSNNIYLGNPGSASDSGVMALGSNLTTKTFIGGIYNATVQSASAQSILMDNAGHLGTTSSSRRFKQDIQDMGEMSSGLMKLRPVAFHYKEFPDSPLEYGLIAEEVDEVYPDLVLHDKDGQIQSVQYHKVNALLLNEVQKEHKRGQQQDETIRQQTERIQSLESRLAALEAMLSSKAITTSSLQQP